MINISEQPFTIIYGSFEGVVGERLRGDPARRRNAEELSVGTGEGGVASKARTETGVRGGVPLRNQVPGQQQSLIGQIGVDR